MRYSTAIADRLQSMLIRPSLMAGLLWIALATLPAAAASDSARNAPGLGASGSFLASVVANSARDTRAAAEFLREALKADPRNPALLDQAFIANLIDGALPEAFKLAERSILRDRSNALAHAALGVRALKAKSYLKARKSFERAGGAGPNPDLTIALLRAWTFIGTGDFAGANQVVERHKEAEVQGYRDFFLGLMAEVAGRPADAEKRLTSAFRTESNTLRVMEAYVSMLSRNGKGKEALAIVETWRANNPGQPYFNRHIEALKTGAPLAPLAASVVEGAAEVFYGLGAIGSAARDPHTAIIYMQLAHYLTPDDDVITMTLAEFFEQLRQFERAGDIYGTIPAGSIFRTRAAIGRAIAFERLERSDDAIASLRKFLQEAPGEPDSADILGSLLRSKKRWDESIAAYASAIDALPKVEQKHWHLYFGRAIGYERTKQWPKAEADFKTALDLLPLTPRTPREKVERAQVLNYLAYSWVDMKMHIEKSFEMLREAVALTPGDGAIVDSLGWAYFRLGRFEEAAKELERAILLKGGDPTINDHLGDAYWKIGRQREARFKWQHALDMNPEPEDRAKIETKLEKGLEELPPAQSPAPKPDGG